MPMEQVTPLLERLAALLHQSVRDHGVQHGLLPIHIQVLSYLARANRYSDLPIAISEYFGITRGTVSQSLTVLERRGFLQRRPDAQDRRRVHFRLTAAGERVLQNSWTTQLEAALRSLPQQGAGLEDALRGLLAGLQRQNGQASFGVCRSCAHFLPEGRGWRCGLTGEPLVAKETGKICREWTRPEPEAA
jgi:MarR family transcriptional regulator, negative regulator of the multidrug operon emrRAB